MTDIARARAILTAVHAEATPGPWTDQPDTGEMHAGQYKDLETGNVDFSRYVGAAPRAADAAFITLMVDLYPAIDALLVGAERNGPGTAAVWYGEGFAAAILAWAERTGYEV